MCIVISLWFYCGEQGIMGKTSLVYTTIFLCNKGGNLYKNSLPYLNGYACQTVASHPWLTTISTARCNTPLSYGPIAGRIMAA